MRALLAIALVTVPVAAAAEPAQLQADLGLAVIGAGYEQPLGDHLAVMGEVQIFGTYFLPWFSLGDNLVGYGGQVRATWFRQTSHHGLYAMGYLRLDRAHDDADTSMTGWCGGGAAGWAFGLGKKLDLRVGAGLQYMRYLSDTSSVDTPFIELDTVVGYRL